MIRLRLERRVTAVVEQMQDYQMPREAWEKALAEHGNAPDALEFMIASGAALKSYRDAVEEVHTVHRAQVSEVIVGSNHLNSHPKS